MKKLTIILGASILSMAAQAASFNWSTTGTIYTPTSSTTAMSGFTAYLFDQSAVSQSTLVANLRAGEALADQTFLTSIVQSAAKVSATVSADVTGSATMYFAIVQDDYVYGDAC